MSGPTHTKGCPGSICAEASHIPAICSCDAYDASNSDSIADALWGLLAALGQANLTPEQAVIVGVACDTAVEALKQSGRVLG